MNQSPGMSTSGSFSVYGGAAHGGGDFDHKRMCVRRVELGSWCAFLSGAVEVLVSDDRNHDEA